MKKKMLSMVLIIVMLFSTMFVLAGCGENKLTINKNNENSSKESKIGDELKKTIENDKGAKAIYEFTKAMFSCNIEEMKKIADNNYMVVSDVDEADKYKYVNTDVDITGIYKVNNLDEFNKYWKNTQNLDYEKDVMPVFNKYNEKFETYIVDCNILGATVQFFFYTINKDGEYKIAGVNNVFEKNNNSEENNKKKEGTKNEENKNEENKNTASNNQSNDLKNMYLEVLEGKRKYIDEENVERTIEDYKELINNTEFEYAIFDLDQDKQDELVAENDFSNLILNYEDGKIYGFYEVYRGMLQLTVDGYCVGSGGAGSNAILTYSFNKNVKSVTTHAEEDIEYGLYAKNTKGIYKVNGRTATEAEYKKCYNDLIESKEKVKFIKFTGGTTNSSQSSTGTETKTTEKTEEKVSVDGKYEYTFPKDGKDVQGSKVTLNLSNGKITYYMAYFDNTMKGTYKVNGNKIEVTYTEQDIFNQGADRMEHNKISTNETYEISGNNLILNNSGQKMTFKKTGT